MKRLWCWRCKMEVPMLDDDEFAIAFELYSSAFKKTGAPLKDRFKHLLEYYESVTGDKETEHNAIMHHQLSQYGSPCENCGKPYRTPKASFCTTCGNNKVGEE